MEWPFEELWDGVSRPSLVVAPLDDESMKIGYFLDNEGKTQQVLVDELYAKSRPVWVLSSNERVEDDLNLPLGTKTPENMGKTQSFTQVLIGELQANANWDSIFQGGPDFKFVRPSSGSFNTGDATIGVTPIVSVIPVNRNNDYKWIRYNQPFDEDWNADMTKQTILVYEDDTSWILSNLKLSAERKIGNTTVKAETTIDIGNRSDLVKIEDFSRDSFLYYAQNGWIGGSCRPINIPCSSTTSWGVWSGVNGGNYANWTFEVYNVGKQDL